MKFLLLAVLAVASASPVSDELEQIRQIAQKYEQRPMSYTELVYYVRQFFKWNNMYERDDYTRKADLSCTICIGIAGQYLGYITNGDSPQEIADRAYALCTTLNLFPDIVCRNVIDMNIDIFVYVVLNSEISATTLCSQALETNCGSVADPNMWMVEIPDTPKPPVTEVHPEEGSPKAKVLHISDTHFDPDYMVGSNAECRAPCCCQEASGPVVGEPAGQWGDYRSCDMPRWTLENMMENIAMEHPDIEYIMWTGDLPAHDVWIQSKEKNLHVLQETVAIIKQYFPDTPVYPALGNHESYPMNIFPPPELTEPQFEMTWLLDAVQNEWNYWIPGSQEDTIKYGGYYVVRVKPGLKMISLNMNYCYMFNWWNHMDGNPDPAQELAWLAQQLQIAEDDGDKVHLIGHIPPGHADCMETWSHQFNRIIDRYEATVTGQFYGHTHDDEVQVFYDMSDDQRPNNVAYVAPAVTPYSNSNPGYRIYYMDGNHAKTTHMVKDHETWYMNLTAANLGNEPVYEKLYSAMDSYNMAGLMPSDWHKLTYLMVEDDDLFNKFMWHHNKASPVAGTCNAECKLKQLCFNTRSDTSNEAHCEEITGLLNP